MRHLASTINEMAAIGVLDVELRNVAFRYGSAEKDCLASVSLRVEPGQFLVLAGKSGCGKTTATRLVNGLVPHFYEGRLSGEALVCGSNAADLPSYERARLVGSVFQDPRSQFFTTDITDEVAFGCENLGFPSECIRENVEAAFAELGVSDLRDRSLFRLSSGQRQRVALASAFAQRPQIYVLDEPSANLDHPATCALGELLGKLKAQGRTVIVAEHRLSYLMDLADRVVYLDEGRLLYDWTPDEFRALGEVRRCALGLRAIAEPRLPAGLTKGLSLGVSAACEVRGLCVSLGGRRVLQNLSLSLVRGEVLGVRGDNGAGKTTLARTLCGICREMGGEILIDGRRASRKKRSRLFSLVLQDADYQLFTESVEDELRFGNAACASLDQRVEEALETLDLADCAARHPLSLSGGQKQRVTIAAAVVREAPFVVFDEPTSGLDGERMRGVASLVRRLTRAGRAVLVISHDAEFLTEACDRVVALGQDMTCEARQ